MYKDLFWHLYDDYVYLDNAASTVPFAAVVEAVEGFLRTYGSIHRGAGKFSDISTAAYENARKTIASFIGAQEDRDCVIFTGNTTEAINMLSLLRPWKCVLTSNIEHSSNFLPWINKTKVITFETDHYRITADAIEKELQKHPEIELVAIAGASNVTGYITPVQDIYNICIKYGVRLFIDASQLAPHYPISLDDCHFVAFSGHKMYAPFGAGVLAGRKDVLSEVGLSTTGGGNVIFIHPQYGAVYQNESLRHEAGTPNGAGTIAIAAAAKVLQSIGWENIIRHNRQICEWYVRYLSEVPGIKLYFPQDMQYDHTPIAIFRIEGMESKEVSKKLSDRNIAVRCGTFCEYRLAEQLMNIPQTTIDETYRNLTTTGSTELPDIYNLIRASAGLLTEEKDIQKLAGALKEISKGA